MCRNPIGIPRGAGHAGKDLFCWKLNGGPDGYLEDATVVADRGLGGCGALADWLYVVPVGVRLGELDSRRRAPHLKYT